MFFSELLWWTVLLFLADIAVRSPWFHYLKKSYPDQSIQNNNLCNFENRSTGGGHVLPGNVFMFIAQQNVSVSKDAEGILCCME